MRKFIVPLLTLAIVVSMILTGCMPKAAAPVAPPPVAPAAPRVEEFKFAVTGVLHPYFVPFEVATKDYMSDTGIRTAYRATVHFDQEEANVIIEGMLAQGYNGFAMWPGHPTAVNATINELVAKGIPVVVIAAPCDLPTKASLCTATDVKASAMEATKHVIEAMGEKGNFVNLLGALSDPNTILRKQGVEETVAKYPGVKIIDEIADIDAFEPCIDKVSSLLAARAAEIDGMVSTCYIPTVVVSEALTEIGDRRIKFVGIDDDPKTLQAIRDGYIVGAMSQAPYAQAYLGCESLRLLKMGYTVKEGVWFINSGFFLINKDNVATYKDIIKSNAVTMLGTWAKDYFNPPK